MWTIVATVIFCSMGQAPDQPALETRTRAISPFMDSGVVAVLQLDLARADLPTLFGRLAAGQASGPFEDASKVVLTWSGRLRGAGARELFIIINAGDMPGLPLVVVPLSQGADGAEIARLFCGGGKEKPPISFPTCATLHNALVAGTPTALDRVRNVKPSSHGDLAAAFAAVGDEQIGLRLLLIPSAETRRILEETVPDLPKEIGGGPITQLTRGVLWVAAGPGFRPQAERESRRRFTEPRRLQVTPSTRGKPGRDGGQVRGFEGDHAGIPPARRPDQDRRVGDRITLTGRCPGRRPLIEPRCVRHERP